MIHDRVSPTRHSSMKQLTIDRCFSSHLVNSEETLLTGLNKISQNKSGMVVVVDEGGYLLGTMTDGDIRRWLSAALKVDLHIHVAEVMNPECIYASVDEKPERIGELLSESVSFVPLVDEYKRVVAIARERQKTMYIGEREVGPGCRTFIIAEIGNNHNGDISRAYDLIDAAAAAGADCAKFQLRDLDSLYGPGAESSAIGNDLGQQYTLSLLERFQLRVEDLYKCFHYVEEKGMIPLCTPWDQRSLERLETWGMKAYKVASADFTNFPFLDVLANTGKPLICSTGMTCEQELLAAIRVLEDAGAIYALLHCNSTYPTPNKDVNLRYIEKLRQVSDGPIGYSGHERGIEVSLAAVALGACIVERHITLDRSLEGNDHRVSLLPSEFKSMADGIRIIEEALGEGSKRVVTQGEMINRDILAKSLVAACDIKAGTRIERDMIAIRSPGQGLQPNNLDRIIGLYAKEDKAAGDYFFESDIVDESTVPREYIFSNRFGIPVRYHDLDFFAHLSNLDLVELHMSFKDLEIKTGALGRYEDLEFVVHAPELFEQDHILDLCSADPIYRRQSLDNMMKVIDVTYDLIDKFKSVDKVKVVVNVGGFTETRHVDSKRVDKMMETLLMSIAELDIGSKVELLPQTMPPFPWHFGGQRFHNLFVDSEFIERFCETTGMRVCLDVSHSRLACNFLKKPFSEFLKRVLPLTSHMHMADAKGMDGEGLQIQEGELDWVELFRLVSELSPDSTFIPEIWQGHKNKGEQMWVALERLEHASICARA